MNKGFEQLYLADNGEDGFNLVTEFVPDLIIADLMMPEMNGYEFCKKLRAMDAYRDVPIIIQSDIVNVEDRAKIFAEGATDILLCPVSPEELTARVCVHIDRQNFRRELHEYRSRMESELRQAHRMQQAILPQPSEKEEALQGTPLKLASFFQSSETLSGDFWGLKRLGEHKLAFYYVDFTGHGLLAALNTFRPHTLINSQFQPTDNPGEYLTQLNACLHPLLPTHHYATMFYGVIDIEHHKLFCASAASPSPIVLKGDGSVNQLEITALPLSVKPDTVYNTHSLNFKPGETLFCFSDALIEAMLPGGGFFDSNVLEATCEQISQKLGGNLASNPETILSHVRTGLHAITGKQRQNDDLTLLALGFSA